MARPGYPLTREPPSCFKRRSGPASPQVTSGWSAVMSSLFRRMHPLLTNFADEIGPVRAVDRDLARPAVEVLQHVGERPPRSTGKGP